MSAFGGKADIALALRTPDLGPRHDPDMDLAVVPETDKPLGSGIGRNAKRSSKLMNARKQDEGIDVGQIFPKHCSSWGRGAARNKRGPGLPTAVAVE